MIWHPNFYVHSSIIHLILLHRASQIVNNGCFIIHKCRISILMKNVHFVGFLIGELEIKCNNILILENILIVIRTISWHFHWEICSNGRWETILQSWERIVVWDLLNFVLTTKKFDCKLYDPNYVPGTQFFRSYYFWD